MFGVSVDGSRFEHLSEFKYLGFALDESVIDGVECRREKFIAIRYL